MKLQLQRIRFGQKRQEPMQRDGWDRSHYGMVSAGVTILLILLLLRAATDLFCLIYALVCAPETLTATDTGTAWRVDYPLGVFLQIGRERMPFVTPVPDGRILALAVAMAGLLTEDLPWLAVAFLVFWLMRLIRDGHSPFLPGVDGCIRRAGWIFLGKGLLVVLIWQVSVSLIAFGRFYLSNPFDLGEIFVGILLLFLADIFRKGRALQQEADETL